MSRARGARNWFGAFATFALLVSFACATNPATGKRQLSLMSEAQEVAIGQQQDVQIQREMGVYSDRDLQQYVTRIGLKLAQQSERPNLPWHFTVVDVPAINAFALPGGYIYITRGILPYLQDEAQLAGVLGHEIGHVNARHAAEQYSRTTGAQLGLILGSIFVPGGATAAQLGASGLGLLFLKYSRDDEAQADALGVRYASRAGWDPDGIPQMLMTLGRIEETSDKKGVPNFLQTHPAAEDRVQRVQAAVSQAEAGASRFTTDRDGYMRHINGMVYGDNPDQGVVRGSTFLHAGLRFALDFPAGWTVANAPTEVVAKQPGMNILIVLEPVERSQGRNLEDVAVSSMQRAGFRVTNGGQTSINGLSAFVGTYQGSLQGIGQVVVRAAHIRQDRNLYLLAGLAPPDLYARAESDFSHTIESFRPMSRGEAEALRPNRIELYTTAPGETWQSIAEGAGQGLVRPMALAIMNGRVVNDQPRSGERLKIVVAG
jgi:predicted Zn-dependent protease